MARFRAAFTVSFDEAPTSGSLGFGGMCGRGRSLANCKTSNAVYELGNYSIIWGFEAICH
jgi:hypothetical protein